MYFLLQCNVFSHHKRHKKYIHISIVSIEKDKIIYKSPNMNVISAQCMENVIHAKMASELIWHSNIVPEKQR